jgi:FkbM family methyltransferase
MNAATRVHRALLGASGRRRRWLQWLRGLLIRLQGDPPCEMLVHGHMLLMPLSHTIPELLATGPQHDRLLGRLGGFVRARRGRLVAIDVGANVGDTVAALMGGAEDRVLAVEPSVEFLRFLRANWGANPQVTIVAAACGERDAELQVSVLRRDGTAVFTETAQGERVQMSTLDAVVRAQPAFADADVVKIDTDGFDFAVLDGAQDLLARARPAVLLECDHFDAPDYVTRCRAALRTLRDCGYAHFAAYDNFGYLMGSFALDDTRPFEHLLFYQLSSPFHYFDLLVMPDDALGAFLETEREHYVRASVSAAMADAARAVAPRVDARP